VGWPPHSVRRFYASFRYRAQSWNRERRVVAKVEWHPGELYPRVGFIVTNLRRPAKKVVAFYNGRGTAEQWIKEGKTAVKWTRLSGTTFRANAVRLQLHALAYNLANFLRTLALPTAIADWSLTSLREKVVKIGAKVVAHGRVRGLPDGRGGGAPRAVPGHPPADRGVAASGRGALLTPAGPLPPKSEGRGVPTTRPLPAIRGQEPPWLRCGDRLPTRIWLQRGTKRLPTGSQETYRHAGRGLRPSIWEMSATTWTAAIRATGSAAARRHRRCGRPWA